MNMQKQIIPFLRRPRMTGANAMVDNIFCLSAAFHKYAGLSESGLPPAISP